MAQTKKQELARARNWTLFRLVGMVIPYNPAHYTFKELELLKTLNSTRMEFINNFTASNKRLGLSIPDKRCSIPSCRCKVVETDRGFNYCKKHLDWK